MVETNDENIVEIDSDSKKLVKKRIDRCLENYFSYIEDKRKNVTELLFVHQDHKHLTRIPFDRHF